MRTLTVASHGRNSRSRSSTRNSRSGPSGGPRNSERTGEKGSILQLHFTDSVNGSNCRPILESEYQCCTRLRIGSSRTSLPAIINSTKCTWLKSEGTHNLRVRLTLQWVKMVSTQRPVCCQLKKVKIELVLKTYHESGSKLPAQPVYFTTACKKLRSKFSSASYKSYRSTQHEPYTGQPLRLINYT